MRGSGEGKVEEEVGQDKAQDDDGDGHAKTTSKRKRGLAEKAILRRGRGRTKWRSTRGLSPLPRGQPHLRPLREEGKKMLPV